MSEFVTATAASVDGDDDDEKEVQLDSSSDNLYGGFLSSIFSCF